MPSEDSRKDFLLSTTANFFGLNENDSSVRSGGNSVPLNEFLDDGSCSVLTVLLSGGHSKKLEFLNKIEKTKDTQDGFLVFFKTKPCVVTPENIHSAVLVSSMFESPATTLYHTLHSLFAPSLLKGQTSESRIDEKLQNLLKELEFGLGSWLRKDGSRVSRRKDGSVDEENLSAIFTPEDEFQFWGDLSATERDSKTRKRAANFLEIFQRGVLAVTCFSIIMYSWRPKLCFNLYSMLLQRKVYIVLRRRLKRERREEVLFLSLHLFHYLLRRTTR